MSETNELTLVYYTCSAIPEDFAKSCRIQLLKSGGQHLIISVSHRPIDLGQNIIVELPRHHLNIYRQALIGAKAASTKYIALCEDDVLYSPEHFKYRPTPGKFAYNLGTWNLFTWGEPLFTHKERRNLSGLICERKLFIETIEERFAKWPDDSKINLGLWAEPGKYERQLGVTVQETEVFYTNPPNIVFTHQAALGFQNLGIRKKLGDLRATEIPTWGSATKIRSLYV